MGKPLPRYPGFCGSSYQSQSPTASIERTVNWYVERMEAQFAKARLVLYPTPGLATKATATESPGRGMFSESGRCFPMIGRKYYELSSVFVLTERGVMLTDAYPTTATTNGANVGDQVFVTSGGEGYIHDLSTNAFTAVVSGATMGGMLNTYFLRFDINTSTLAISDALDGLTWDPLQFVQRSSSSDPWRSMLVRPPGIWLIGEKTGDIYFDAQAFPFPFQQIQNVRIPKGIIAPFSLKDFSTGPIWLSSNEDGDGEVVQAQGYKPVPISDHALAWAISQYKRNSRIDDAVAFVYQDQGHEFYELNFPTAKATWVFDRTTQKWHERGHWNIAMGQYEAWGPQYHTNAFSKHLVADHRTGDIYDMSVTEYSDANGDPLRRERIAPALNTSNKLVRYSQLEVVVQSGVGVGGTGAGSDPQMVLSTSNDGGQTFGAERMRSAGKIGEYGKRLVWNNLGAATNFAAKIVCTDPVPWRVIDCFLKVAS